MRVLLFLIVGLSIQTNALFAQLAPAPPKQSSLVGISQEIRSLSQRISPAVVQILVSGYGSLEQGAGHHVSALDRQESTGSGVIVDPNGYIMTNSHVVLGAVRTRVFLARGAAGKNTGDDPGDVEGLDANIVGVDTESDLALLKIERSGLPALKFMNSGRLRQGDLVLAIGAPLGLRNSVSLGVVSAPARSLSDDSAMVYVQTDASINPGNSGGALVNASGLLAGLNTFILTQSGGNEGLGFAIPSNTVRDVYLQLRKYGHVHRGDIGVFTENITPVMAKGLSLARDHGVIVSDVEPESPADRAGLKRGDLILSLDGQNVQSASQIENRMFRRQAGDKIVMHILRADSELDLSLSVRERADKANILARLAHPEKNLIARLGVLCIEIDKDIAAMIPGLRREYGLIVAAKSAGGQSQFIDLQPGDIIDAVNTFPVPFLETLRSALDRMNAGDPVVLQIERDGRFQYLAFELDR
ncbi:MAG TPA: trypsin-like peptidase domain-containing protein [Bryobacteraceae bacterium]|nr:trypsin-like peptidase domain-containing protein [Bryobacteraceae bacterium]